MKKRQRLTSQPVRKKTSLARSVRKRSGLTRSIRKPGLFIIGGLICLGLALITLAAILGAVWLAISGEWDGSIEVLDKSFIINPALATALAWATVVTLIIATLSFYYLILSLYKRGFVY